MKKQRVLGKLATPSLRPFASANSNRKDRRGLGGLGEYPYLQNSNKAAMAQLFIIASQWRVHSFPIRLLNHPRHGPGDNRVPNCSSKSQPRLHYRTDTLSGGGRTAHTRRSPSVVLQRGSGVMHRSIALLCPVWLSALEQCVALTVLRA